MSPWLPFEAKEMLKSGRSCTGSQAECSLAVQSVITANGRHKVPFPELVIEGKPNWRDLDVRRAQGMAGMLAAQINASCAAACASMRSAPCYLSRNAVILSKK